MKKIIASMAVGMFMFTALPALAMTGSDAMMHKEEMMKMHEQMNACIKTARATRNASLKAVQQNYIAAVKVAQGARHEGMMSAHDDHAMVMMAKDHYKEAIQKARSDRAAARQAARDQYKTDLAACKK